MVKYGYERKENNMKKLLSVSVVALLAMVPTMGWAAFDGIPSTQADPRVDIDEHPYVSEELSEFGPAGAGEHVIVRTSTDANGLTEEYGFRRKGAGLESIVSNQEPKYNVEKITADDGSDVAALSFVKGAYNDVITKINKVYDVKEKTSQRFNLKKTWGSTSATPKVSLITINNVANEDSSYSWDRVYYSLHVGGSDDHEIYAHTTDQGQCVEYGEGWHPAVDVNDDTTTGHSHVDHYGCVLLDESVCGPIDYDSDQNSQFELTNSRIDTECVKYTDHDMMGELD